MRTLCRSLHRCHDLNYKDTLAKAMVAYRSQSVGLGAMIMYDVTTLHFETKKEDDLRKVGMSKEHRVDPQIQVGLLVDPTGLPLEMHMFVWNQAETTIVPVDQAFQERQDITDMVVVADAGLLSAANFTGSSQSKRVAASTEPRHQVACHGIEKAESFTRMKVPTQTPSTAIGQAHCYLLPVIFLIAPNKKIMGTVGRPASAWCLASV